MSSSRVAALRRARQRQVRIEAATAHAMNAQAGLTRAIDARQAAAERHDERVRDAEEKQAAAAAELARICGSAEAASEILGWSVRDVRKVVKAQHDRYVDAPSEPLNRPRRQASAAPTGGGSGGELGNH